MTEPTIAEERIARSLAFWHGQKIVYRRPDGEAITVARLRSERYRHWSAGPENYSEGHWREYIEAARAILRIRE